MTFILLMKVNVKISKLSNTALVISVTCQVHESLLGSNKIRFSSTQIVSASLVKPYCATKLSE